METIKVNMTPCEDIKTIHASQNDNEAREWGFELHNNGEKIDSSSISDQLVFKPYKGGTEQILPTNGSTPTTSPFKGDIKYPQGLLTDQEFTYRQSPTEEDGLAKITDIKGNTLVLNQLWDYENISFQQGLTVTKPGDGVYLINGTRTTAASGDAQNVLKSGHKYLIKSNTDNGTIVVTNSITWETTQATYILNATADGMFTYFINPGTYTNVKFIPQVIDLTLMFGSGNEPTSVSEFSALFPLPYYSYNQGTLLSFNGNGIKTVGKNLLPTDLRMTNLYGLNDDKSIYQFNTSSAPFTWSYENSVFRTTLPSGNYKVGFIAKTKATPSSAGLVLVDSDNNFLVSRGGSLNNLERGEYSFSLTKTTDLGLCAKVYDGVWWLYIIDAENEMATYEPYTSSTLSLPISTYFPNGMKSAGSVYDELTETKAITRIGSITVNGSEAWVKSTSYTGNYYVLGILLDAKYPNPNAISNRLILVYNTTQLSENDLCFMFDGTPGSLNINIKNTSMATVDQFKAWLQANPVTIYYELSTPTETSFTTTSLVTENTEIPLSNEDGILIGKCTEQLSSESGFFDAKIKLADEDGECYSNKIQLHVERKPS